MFTRFSSYGPKGLLAVTSRVEKSNMVEQVSTGFVLSKRSFFNSVAMSNDAEEEMDPELRKELQEAVDTTPVVLFMKGVPDAPQCGFSGGVVQILRTEGLKEYGAVNVLSDPELREGIKEFSSWPTIPQLYVKGEFVGGYDILKEMHESGELKELLEPVIEEIEGKNE